MMAWYDAALARLPVPHHSFKVPTRFGETHILAAGPDRAPPVMLLHALSGNALMWAQQFSALSASFRVYAPDVIGMAGRSAPTRLPYDGRGYAMWLAEVMQRLDLERAALVGIGFGGWVIARLAAHRPGRIASAALLSPAGFLPVRWQQLVPVIWDVLFINDAQARRLARTMLAQPDHSVDAQAVELQYLIIKHFRNQLEAPPLPDDDLSRLTAPTLVLVGENEQVWNPKALVTRAHRTLPNLTAAEIVPRLGHGLLAHQPEAISARLLRFLNGSP